MSKIYQNPSLPATDSQASGQHDLSAADLARVLGCNRSHGPKLLHGERRLTVDHIRILAPHFQIDPGVLV